jgi:hypothetical protein
MRAEIEALARLRRLVQSVDSQTPQVDEALPALRKLLEDAAVPFKLIGGIAVVHHGYARMTEDIDVLIDPSGLDQLDLRLAVHAFARESRTRLRHVPTGVRVDLLVAGDPGPRPADPPYPSPSEIASSPDDAAFVGLSSLITLKLRARRHQDLADVVALLKPLNDARYFELEAETPQDLRHALADLRRDALEELGTT